MCWMDQYLACRLPLQLSSSPTTSDTPYLPKSADIIFDIPRHSEIWGHMFSAYVSAFRSSRMHTVMRRRLPDEGSVEIINTKQCLPCI